MAFAAFFERQAGSGVMTVGSAAALMLPSGELAAASAALKTWTARRCTRDVERGRFMTVMHTISSTGCGWQGFAVEEECQQYFVGDPKNKTHVRQTPAQNHSLAPCLLCALCGLKKPCSFCLSVFLGSVLVCIARVAENAFDKRGAGRKLIGAGLCKRGEYS